MSMYTQEGYFFSQFYLHIINRLIQLDNVITDKDKRAKLNQVRVSLQRYAESKSALTFNKNRQPISGISVQDFDQLSKWIAELESSYNIKAGTFKGKISNVRNIIPLYDLLYCPND